MCLVSIKSYLCKNSSPLSGRNHVHACYLLMFLFYFILFVFGLIIEVDSSLNQFC